MHDLGVPDEEPDAPAREREPLRQGVELDRDVLRAVRLQDRRRRVPVEAEVGVREVVHEQHVALPCEVDDGLHEGAVDDLRRRVVREREDDDARLRLGVLVRVDERRDQVGGGRDGDPDDRRTGEDGREQVDRIARCRHEHRIARLDEHPEEMAEALLRAHRRDRLGLGVELDPVAARVPVADRASQVREAAARRVAVVARVLGGLAELLDRDLRRREVGVPEAEVDDVFAGPPQLQLEPVDLREDVRRQAGDAPELHQPVFRSAAAIPAMERSSGRRTSSRSSSVASGSR